MYRWSWCPAAPKISFLRSSCSSIGYVTERWPRDDKSWCRAMPSTSSRVVPLATQRRLKIMWKRRKIARNTDYRCKLFANAYRSIQMGFGIDRFPNWEFWRMNKGTNNRITSLLSCTYGNVCMTTPCSGCQFMLWSTGAKQSTHRAIVRKAVTWLTIKPWVWGWHHQIL